ncbi:MAG: NAD(P)/FAD-dependent oxidoreductase [Bacteroidetes bacterium]|nr:NAD(P)/FAD-dependent oxidoreductase [Bacteroidota bacterium]
MKKIIIAGGGLAGLITASVLAKRGISCLVIEKKEYPFHRVCGEYISNETVPFLKSEGLFPAELDPSAIHRFQLTSVNGKLSELPLDLGGFGISRYQFDYFLFQKAKATGVEFLLNTEVDSIIFADDKFFVETRDKKLEADVVVGAFGKRSKLDVALQRPFIRQRSPYVGVKYHVRTNHPSDVIALHNFKDGYCGISNIEDGKSNLCYLTHRDNLKRYGSIEQMEKEVLFENPFLKTLFSSSEFLFEKPEVINEISFEKKSPVEDHILMCGDAAGMITPLCGNGMAIAIHSAAVMSELIIRYCQNEISRDTLEKTYASRWQSLFSTRLWAGRQIQRLFGGVRASNLAVTIAQKAKPVANFLIRQTHGNPF